MPQAQSFAVPVDGMAPVPWAPRGDLFEAGTALKYRFVGSVALELDPEYAAHCAQYNETCASPLVLGPLGHPTWRWFGVYGRVGTQNGDFRSLATWDDERWEYTLLDADTRIEVMRREGYYHSCNSGGVSTVIPMYRVATGAHELEVVPLGTRLSVDRQFAAPGDSVTFTATSFGGTATATEWYFYPDAGGMVSVGQRCRNQSTCRWRVDAAGPGVMRMDATMNGMVGSWTHAPRIEARSPEVKLTCNGPVVRAQEITCTVRSEPEGVALEVREWQFDPDSVVIHPLVGRVAMAGSVTEADSATEWKGLLVLPGRITVRAVLGSALDSASVRVQVTERSWDTGRLWHGRVEPGWGHEHRPLTDVNGGHVLAGDNIHVPTREALALYDGAHSGIDFSQIETVAAGPNRGYVFIRQHEIRINRAYRVNKYITEPNDHEDIRISGRNYNRWHALIRKGWGNPAVLFDATVRHETYGTGGRIGHQEGMEQGITGDVCGNLARRIERIAGSPSLVQEEADRAWRRAREFLWISTSHHRVYGHKPAAGAPIVMRSTSSAAPIEAVFPRRKQEALDPLEFRDDCEYAQLGV